MAEQYANVLTANPTLSAGIDNVVTSLTVTDGSTYPAGGDFRVRIDNEIIVVGARSGVTLSSLTRGAEGTTAASHSFGAEVKHELTAASLKALPGVTGNFDVTGNLSAVGSIGYAVGAGGAVTQITSKSTGVTLNELCGAITMQAAALAAAAKVSFVVTNSTVGANDVVIVNVKSGGTANAYRANVTAVAAGSFTVTVENITGGSLSESPVIAFAVIKGVIT
jgi:hypothetical protein